MKRENASGLKQFRLEKSSALWDPPEVYLEPDQLPVPTMMELRFALQSHLVRSKMYDPRKVLKMVEGTWLYEEQVTSN